MTCATGQQWYKDTVSYAQMPCIIALTSMLILPLRVKRCRQAIAEASRNRQAAGKAHTLGSNGCQQPRQKRRLP